MFNEILTGKASLEAKSNVPPFPQEPPRPAPPQQVRTVSAAQYDANVLESARAMHEAEENFRRSEASHRLMKGLLFIGLAILLGFIRYQMRQ